MFTAPIRTASLTLGLALAAVFSAHAAPGINANQRTGEQVYKQTCFACHGNGIAGAPKFGDKKVWAPLIAEGQHVLTGHAFVGVRAMPARGGDPKLTLVEFSRAVAYMAREAGADWKDPDAPTMMKIVNEADKRLQVHIRDANTMHRELQALKKAK